MAEKLRVVVFGSTGNVGSVVACTAQSLGSKVFLAMRDTQKAIPGLSTEQEKNGNFDRVQVDLTDPETIETTIRATKAKHAFIYRARNTPDHMQAAIKALKSAGIEFVVFLSTSTIRGEPADVPPEDLVAYLHAQVEIQLEDVFPGRYVAVRAGRFATNMLRFKDGIAAGHVKLFAPNFVQDLITPEDMGGVSGTILVRGMQEGDHRVELYGPHLYTQQEAIEFIASRLRKAIKIVDIDEREAIEHYTKAGVAKPVAEYMVKNLGDLNDEEYADQQRFKAGVTNVLRYTGKSGMGLAEWVDSNRHAFEQ